jgi:hypothetical protein
MGLTSSVRPLGIEALFLGPYGRLLEEISVVIVRACIDESSTHGDPKSPLLLYACVSRLSYWERFDKAWRKTLKQDSVSYVHAKDLLNTNGEFKGWKINRKVAFSQKLDNIIRKRIEFCFCTVLHKKDFEDYRKHIELNTLLESDYGVSFRLLLSFLLVAVPQIVPHPPHDIYLVVEDGHENSGAARELVKRIKKEIPDCPIRAVTYVNKYECSGTQAADMQALAALNLEEIGGRPDVVDIPRDDIKGSSLPQKPPVYRLPLRGDILTDLRDQVILSRPKFRRRFRHLLSSVRPS